jgi:hypothetical protein
MKKRTLIAGLSLIIAINFLSAVCELEVSLVNQDPYPAVPGEYVKLVFQVSGVDSTECNGARFELFPDYPFYLDNEEKAVKTLPSSTYVQDFKTQWMVTYKVRVDRDALDGKNTLEVGYSGNSIGLKNFSLHKIFDIEVKDVKADFEVSVSDYNIVEKKLSLEILNIGNSDVSAVTIELPEQEGIILYGTNRKIAGDIDSNEDERVTFNADLKAEEIDILIKYTDSINERRTLEKKLFLDKQAFLRTLDKNSGVSSSFSFFLGLLTPIVIYFVWRYWKKRKIKQKEMHRH